MKRKYMEQPARTLMYQPKYGIKNNKINSLIDITKNIDKNVIFTFEGGTDGNAHRLDCINTYISVHNNNLRLELGEDVRNGKVDYTYIFGCPDKNNLYRLIGYYKNGNVDENLINKEYKFDIGSLKDFVYDRANNYINELENEDEWQDNNAEWVKEFEEQEEME